MNSPNENKLWGLQINSPIFPYLISPMASSTRSKPPLYCSSSYNRLQKRNGFQLISLNTHEPDIIINSMELPWHTRHTLFQRIRPPFIVSVGKVQITGRPRSVPESSILIDRGSPICLRNQLIAHTPASPKSYPWEESMFKNNPYIGPVVEGMVALLYSLLSPGELV